MQQQQQQQQLFLRLDRQRHGAPCGPTTSAPTRRCAWLLRRRGRSWRPLGRWHTRHQKEYTWNTHTYRTCAQREAESMTTSARLISSPFAASLSKCRPCARVHNMRRTPDIV